MAKVKERQKARASLLHNQPSTPPTGRYVDPSPGTVSTARSRKSRAPVLAAAIPRPRAARTHHPETETTNADILNDTHRARRHDILLPNALARVLTTRIARAAVSAGKPARENTTETMIRAMLRRNYPVSAQSLGLRLAMGQAGRRREIGEAECRGIRWSTLGKM